MKIFKHSEVPHPLSLQPLLVERNFLEIVFRGADDINNPNNLFGFEGKINEWESAWTQPSREQFFDGPNGRRDPNEFIVIMHYSCVYL